MTLSWPASSSASGYFVYRDGNPTPVDYAPITAPITGTTHEDIGLTNGRTYTYTIAPIGSNAIPGNHLNLTYFSKFLVFPSFAVQRTLS